MERGPFASFGGNATAVIGDHSDNGNIKRVDVIEIGATGVWKRFRPAVLIVMFRVIVAV
jgi:hypothetical protein